MKIKGTLCGIKNTSFREGAQLLLKNVYNIETGEQIVDKGYIVIEWVYAGNKVYKYIKDKFKQLDKQFNNYEWKNNMAKHKIPNPIKWGVNFRHEIEVEIEPVSTLVLNNTQSENSVNIIGKLTNNEITIVNLHTITWKDKIASSEFNIGVKNE